MTSEQRWLEAQQYEKGYWSKRKTQISTGETDDLGWYEWRATELMGQLDRLGLSLSDPESRVLEIGSGPVGVVSFLPGGTRVAVDPLADFFGEDEVLAGSRNPDVDYRQGVGEDLPVADDAFNLVIMENCIDHVQDVDAVMKEIRRALKRDGVLYLTVNCRTPIGYWVHRVMSRIRIDAGHPHTFTWRRARRLLEAHDFELRHFSVGSYPEAFLSDLRSPSARDRGKALLGVSEFLTSAIAVK